MVVTMLSFILYFILHKLFNPSQVNNRSVQVRVNSPKLVSCLHEEIDSFVQCIRHSIESVTAPRFYSPPPVSLLTHYGTPLLNAKLVLIFFVHSLY